MTTITFDTLAYVKTLREAGIEEKQAEARKPSRWRTC